MPASPSERAAILRAWLPVGAWIAVIFALSGDRFAASSTSRFLGPLLAWLLPGLSPDGLELAHGLVRKGAHLAEYGVLALLALRARLRSAAPAPRAAAFAFALVLGVAVADEARQATSAARTGALLDVGLDTAGGLAALAAAGLLERARPALRRPRAAAPGARDA